MFELDCSTKKKTLASIESIAKKVKEHDKNISEIAQRVAAPVAQMGNEDMAEQVKALIEPAIAEMRTSQETRLNDLHERIEQVASQKSLTWAEALEQMQAGNSDFIGDAWSAIDSFAAARGQRIDYAPLGDPSPAADTDSEPDVITEEISPNQKYVLVI